MKRRTFLASAAGLAAPSIAGAGAANTIRFVPQAGLSNLDPIWTTIDVVRNAGLSVHLPVRQSECPPCRLRPGVSGQSGRARLGLV